MRSYSRLGLVSVLGVLFVCVAWVPAQVRPGDVDKLGSLTDLKWFKENNRHLDFDKTMKGLLPASADTAKQLFEYAAKVYVFRVTWFDSIQRSPDTMEKARDEFRKVIANALLPDSRKNNQEAIKLWTPMVVSCFKQIFDLPFDKNRLSILNAAVLLPDLAKLKQPQIADLLVNLIEDPKKHDVVKRWAAEGLIEFFPAREFDVTLDSRDKTLVQRKAAELKRINALLKMVTRQWNPPKDASPNEIEGFRYVRRMAIRALGEARIPAIVADAKSQKLEGAVVPALLPFLGRGTVSPEPSLSEKIEAAIAIAKLQVSPTSAYQPEEGIYRAGTVLVELADAYKGDYNRFGGGKGKIPTMLPWKYHGKRLQMALNDMFDSIRNDNLRADAAANAQKLGGAAQALLGAMQRNQANYDRKNLADVVDALRPKSAVIYKGLTTPDAPAGE